MGICARFRVPQFSRGRMDVQVRGEGGSTHVGLKPPPDKFALVTAVRNEALDIVAQVHKDGHVKSAEIGFDPFRSFRHGYITYTIILSLVSP